MGGSKENRNTPSVDHWSLAVKNGKALEQEWHTEIPIPRGGPHRFVLLCVFYSFTFHYIASMTDIIS